MTVPAGMTEVNVLLGRHLRHLVRMPERLLGVTIMPIAYVVLFGVLFGSAMQAPGGDYRSYFMAGILAQTMLTNVSSTALGIASDLGGGLVERFRSLPMSPLSVVVARTSSALVLSVISIVVMTVVGFLMGWRVTTGPWSALGAFALLLGLGLVMSWAGFLLGVMVKDPEAISSVAALVILPVTFLSNAFIPLDGLPRWLATICEWNPLSTVVTACRQLFGNPTGATNGTWSGAHPVAASVAVLVVGLAVLVPLTVRAYRRAVAR